MKICFVILRMGVGGAERMLVALGRGLLARGHQVTIASEGGAFVTELEALGVRHLQVIGLPGRKVVDQVRSLFRLRRIFAELEPDIINVHAFTALPATWLASLMSGVKARRCFTVHIPENPLFYLAMGPTLRFMVEDVSTVCQHTIGELHRHRLPAELGTVIYNGIDRSWLLTPEEIEARPLPGTRSPVRLGVLARLIARKGIQDLIEAVAMLLGDGSHDITLEIVGEGPHRKALETLIAERGLTGRVQLRGEERKVREFLDRIDLFILPSHFEGLPMAMLEAMARGVPTLCTAVNGIPEVSREGETGFLFKALDVLGLVEAVRKILADPERSRAVRQAARAQIEARFLTEQMVDGYEQWFQKILERDKRTEE